MTAVRYAGLTIDGNGRSVGQLRLRMPTTYSREVSSTVPTIAARHSTDTIATVRAATKR